MVLLFMPAGIFWVFIICQLKGRDASSFMASTTRAVLGIRGGENLEDQRNFTSVSIDTPTNSGQNSSNSYTGNKPEPQNSEIDIDSGMMRVVDPMMIDDDIFSENNLVAEQHDLYNTLGNPPEPPKALSERSGITAYVPNMIEEEDDDGSSRAQEHTR